METGAETVVRADRVVLSLGSHPAEGLQAAYEKVFDRVIPVGSAEKDGRIGDATKAGIIKGWSYDD